MTENAETAVGKPRCTNSSRATCSLLISLVLASGSPSEAQVHSDPPYLQNRLLPGQHDLIWNYDTSKPLLGPNSDIDKLLRDGGHRPYPAISRLNDSKKTLSEAAESCTLSSEELLAGIIKVVPPARGEDAVTLDGIKSAREALNHFPRAILCLLYQNRCFVLLTPYLTTAAPELKQRKPVGLELVQSYDEIGGVFSKEHGAIVAENIYNYGQSIKNPRLQKSLAHETGHALDHLLKDASLSIEFIAVYEKDRKQMSATQRQARQYFMQEGGRGPTEAFADLTAALYSCDGNFLDSKIARVFPNCAKLVQGYLPGRD